MSKSAPKAPDYEAAAQAQAQSSKEVTEQQTWANRPDQVTPWGEQTWQNQSEWDPTTNQYINRWTQNTTLNPESQQALDAQLALTNQRSQLGLSLGDRMRNEYGQAMEWNGFQDLAGTPEAQRYGQPNLQGQLDTQGLQNVDPSQRYQQNANDAIYNQWAQRAMPAQAQATDALRTQLYNQGLKEGDAAYDAEMNKLRMQQGDAQQQAAYQATIGSGAEASRMYGMDEGTRAQQFGERQAQGTFANQAANQQLQNQLASGAQTYGQQLSSAGYQNQLRQQQIAEAMQQRGFSLNEINALLTGQQVGMPSMPGFQSAQRAEGTQNLSAAQMTGQANLDAFNAQQAGMNGMMSGLGGLAGAAPGILAMSDRRMKRRIRRIGTTPGGTPLYAFNYVFGGPRRIGVMADEAPRDAVINIGGFNFVDYAKVS